ncbi:OsmC family protein [Piscinibacter koreensis]|uniref:OsmC family protein n=1 Tax=Piscinibacter koreensis TaxID=2742824 RepID=A0A7Y6TVV6_9BURK|nr:OsmC family protein [Schlegelella koreensis]NUZ05357.1 OsmC family protein [Schlegelella koreensis]
MKITATLRNSGQAHAAAVCTEGNVQEHRRSGPGAWRRVRRQRRRVSDAGLATCYCNDLYREARRLGLQVHSVEVEASADFLGVGLAASNVRYRARVHSPESAERLDRLLRETDAVAEVHNTLRAPTQVALVPWSEPA